MVALPATGSLHGGLEDDGGWHEGSGSGDWSVYDDEDGIYEYPDYGSGSGDGGIHDAYQDTFDGDTLLPPERPHDGDVHIGTDEEQEEVVPRTNVPPATTAVPPKEKAAGAAAVSASCWPLLLAMLAAARW
ncbi:uncharacterized protein LOC119096502 [Pollicipes pollicipes]|uniref:uncharacterized protein LOC119096502 n=1 Tax=Pollicipes pollicipes TaxID=41117 RepID=UPI001884EC59|nr:uncharacterized protein LOC119096502 [Pollicipes pollicipes]